MEDCEIQVVLATDLSDPLLGFIESPICSQISTILVAVRITDHDHLMILASFEVYLVWY
jgi:hypothetical protein